MRTFDLPGQRYSVDALQFSPDGKLLAAQSYGRIEVIDVATGPIRHVPTGNVGRVGTPGVGFTADSRGLVYFHNEKNDVRVFDLQTEQDRVVWANKAVPWSPRGNVKISTPTTDGRLVLVAYQPEERTVEIVALDPASGERKFSFARHRAYLRELAVSPEGDWVAGCTVNEVRAWDVGDGKRPSRATRRVQDRERVCFGNLALSRGGAYLAAGTFHRSVRIDVWDLQTGERQKLGDPEATVGGIAFAPDRPLLAFGQQRKDAGEVVFFDVRTRTELRRFDWKIGTVGAIAFSLDGCRCATASKDTAVVWDVDV